MKSVYLRLFVMGAILICFSSKASSDTVKLNDGYEIKGLVVEEHHDRILLSTSEGEKIFFRKAIAKIEYDDPEYSLMGLGREMESGNRWGEALSYYEKALEINPRLKEAREAVLGIKSKVWARAAEGPSSEIAKQQDLADARAARVDLEEIVRSSKEGDTKLLWERMGLKFTRSEEWVIIRDVRRSIWMPHEKFKSGDALVSMDGKSLRYLDQAIVTREFLEPRYASAAVRIQRKISVQPPKQNANLKDYGFVVKQKYEGLLVSKVSPEGFADKSGLQEGDVIQGIDGEKTRYLPAKEAISKIQGKREGNLELVVERLVNITRK